MIKSVRHPRFLSLLILGQFFYASILSGQGLNLPDSNATWTTWEYTFRTDGDSVLNGLHYTKFSFSLDSVPQSWHHFALLREDSSKTFVVFADSVSEQLLYRFDAQIWDTLIQPTYLMDGYYKYTGLIVTDIDTVSIMGQMRRRLRVEDWYSWGSPSRRFDGKYEYIVEGIGSTAGLFSPGASTIRISHFAIPYLFCVHQDSALVYRDSFYLAPNCWNRRISGDLDELSAADLKLFPNPSNGQIRIEHYLDLPTQLKIYDASGVLVFKQRLEQAQAEIDLSHLPSCIYALELQASGGIRSSSHFCISH